LSSSLWMVMPTHTLTDAREDVADTDVGARVPVADSAGLHAREMEGLLHAHVRLLSPLDRGLQVRARCYGRGA
jgi:hypothetical protein